MKQKHLYSLLDTSYTTIGVTFSSGSAAQRPTKAPQARMVREAPWEQDEDYEGQSYVYKAPLEFDIKLGDFVVVHNEARGYRVGKVCRVDAHPQIDIDASFDYKWIVQRIDVEGYDKRNEAERVFSDAMLQIERVRQREMMLKGFQDTLPDGSEARRLFDQTVGKLTGPVIDGSAPSS